LLSPGWAGDHVRALDVYVLMGQSNMSGRAPLEGLVAFPNAAHVSMLRAGQWLPAQEPVSDEPGAKLGPGLPFANALFTVNHRDSGLIPCSKGGTKIDEWLPSRDPNTLYGSCIEKLANAGVRSSLKGLLYYQGEFDTWTLKDAESWPRKFVDLIESFRRDAGNPDLPVVFTQIGPRPDPYWEPQARLIELQGKLNLRMGAMVSATDLEFQSDRLHLTQEGELTLGTLYARAMVELQAKLPPQRGP
jgi:hypothetical protein